MQSSGDTQLSYTADELALLIRPRFGLIAEAVDQSRWEDAARLAAEAKTEHAWVHDGYRNLIARCLTVLLDTYGQDAVEALGADVQGLMKDWHQSYATAEFEDQVRQSAAAWHWHMTRFRLVEDEDKVSFLLEPCGSGGRLINDGAYYRTVERPFALMPVAGPSTFGMDDFPIYCNHCSEIASHALMAGSYGFLMEGWTQAHRFGQCRQHAFKRLSSVPDDYFVRTGVNRSKIRERNPDRDLPARVFTDEQLADIATPPMDRLEQALALRDADLAAEITRECQHGWRTMIHDAYRDWSSSIYSILLKNHGGQALKDNIAESGSELFGPILQDITGQPEVLLLNAWAVYWRSHEAIVDIGPTDYGWMLVLDPGRVFNEGQAKQWPGGMKWFCRSVNASIAEQGLAGLFGTLTSSARGLVHEIPGQR